MLADLGPGVASERSRLLFFGLMQGDVGSVVLDQLDVPDLLALGGTSGALARTLLHAPAWRPALARQLAVPPTALPRWAPAPPARGAPPGTPRGRPERCIGILVHLARRAAADTAGAAGAAYLRLGAQVWGAADALLRHVGEGLDPPRRAALEAGLAQVAAAGPPRLPPGPSRWPWVAELGHVQGRIDVTMGCVCLAILGGSMLWLTAFPAPGTAVVVRVFTGVMGLWSTGTTACMLGACAVRLRGGRGIDEVDAVRGRAWERELRSAGVLVDALAGPAAAADLEAPWLGAGAWAAA